jgi:hypothetical protein
MQSMSNRELKGKILSALVTVRTAVVTQAEFHRELDLIVLLLILAEGERQAGVICTPLEAWKGISYWQLWAGAA